MATAENPLVTAPLGRSLARLAAPGLFGVILQSVVSISEAWYLGAIGKTALAGVALVFPIYMLNTMLSAGSVGGAVSGAIARACGEQNFSRAESIARCAMFIAVVGSLTIMALYYLFGDAFFRLLGGKGEVLQAAKDYSLWFFPGIAAIWLYNMSSALLRGSGDMVRPMFAAGAIAASHFVLAGVFIHGAGPIPAMGIDGAGLAIVVAFGIGWIILLFCLRQRKRDFRLVKGGIDGAAMKPILKNGLLAANQSVVTIALSLLTTAIFARFGDAWLAGYGIGVRLELIMVPVIFGFGSALIAITGANIGAGLRERALSVAWKGAFINAVIIGAVGLVMALFPDIWSSNFTNSETVAYACNIYLNYVGPFYVFFGLGLCLYFASQGFGTMLIPVLGTYVRFAIVAAGSFILIKTGTDTPENILLVIAAALIVYGVFIALGLRFGPWRK